MTFPAALTLAALALFVPAIAPPSGTNAPGPTVAVEDTMRTSVPEVLIRAPRVTLAEILDRVARGEARRDSLLKDESFRAVIRLVANQAGPAKQPELESETVVRVYKKRPDRARSVTLRTWERHPDKKNKDKDGEKGVNIRFRSDMSEEIVNSAFRPAARRDFKYRIVGRDLAGNHLIYRIAFEPRSPLDPERPNGVVWVDTNEFVIVRQEVDFTRSPVPIFLKGIHRMVIERTRVDSYWVLNRVLLRAELTFAVPKVGRSFDIGIAYDGYTINTGLPDSLFTAKAE
jgi:hypothetical protein